MSNPQYTAEELDQGIQDLMTRVQEGRIQDEQQLHTIIESVYEGGQQLPDADQQDWLNQIRPEQTRDMPRQKLTTTIRDACQQMLPMIRQTDRNTREQVFNKLQPAMQQISGQSDTASQRIRRDETSDIGASQTSRRDRR